MRRPLGRAAATAFVLLSGLAPIGAVAQDERAPQADEDYGGQTYGGGYAMPPAQTTLAREVAVLRWLDKVTARVDTVEIPVNQTVRVQTLEIIVRACLERPPEDPPESAAFLDVWEVKPGEPADEVFRGWMFASSPALSAMEHPVYDLWVLDCRDRDEASRAKDSTSSSDMAP
jgi:hypothetical protein